MLDAGTVTTLTEPVLVPPKAQRLCAYLASWISMHKGERVPELDVNNPPWQGGWQPVSSRGRLSKRITKYYLEVTGKKMNDRHTQRVNDLLSASVIYSNLTLRITDKLDWNPGDYGDSNSCFFTVRRQTFPLLYHLGGRAVQITGEQGNGRALILEDDNGWPFVFNAYGPYNLEAVAALLAKAQPEPFSTGLVAASALDSHRLPVYINQGIGYLFGPYNYVNSLIESGGAVQRGYRSRLGYFCEMCNCGLDTNWSSSQNRRYPTNGKDFALVCDDCVGEALASREKRWVGTGINVYAPRTKKGERIIGRQEPPAVAKPSEMGYGKNWIEKDDKEMSRQNWISNMRYSTPSHIYSRVGSDKLRELAVAYLDIYHPFALYPYEDVEINNGECLAFQAYVNEQCPPPPAETLERRMRSFTGLSIPSANSTVYTIRGEEFVRANEAGEGPRPLVTTRQEIAEFLVPYFIEHQGLYSLATYRHDEYEMRICIALWLEGVDEVNYGALTGFPLQAYRAWAQYCNEHTIA